MFLNHLKINIVLLAFFMLSDGFAQVNYTVNEADATKFNSFTHFEISTHLLGTTGMGFSLGAQNQFQIPSLPVTFSGRFRWEVLGLAKVENQGEAFGVSRNIEIGAMLPILPGSKKPGRVKVTTSYETSNTHSYEEYFYADGEKKNELMAKASIFRYWTNGNFNSAGIAAGLVLRMRKHVDVSLAYEPSYHRETFKHVQLYADALYAAILDSFFQESEEFTLGGRIGFLRAASSGMNYYTELELRPGLIGTLTFGWLFGWERY